MYQDSHTAVKVAIIGAAGAVGAAIIGMVGAIILEAMKQDSPSQASTSPSSSESPVNPAETPGEVEDTSPVGAGEDLTEGDEESTTLPTLTVSTPTVDPGESVTFTGSGFAPGERIWLESRWPGKEEYNQIMDVTADEEGEFSIDVVIDRTIINPIYLPKRLRFRATGESENSTPETSLHAQDY